MNSFSEVPADCLHIMPRKRNEVLVKWMDKSCKGQMNKVNVNHLLADAEDITVGAILTARMNSKCYKGRVADLLEWSAPTKSKRKAASARNKKKAAPEASTAEAAREENMKGGPKRTGKKAAPDQILKKAATAKSRKQAKGKKTNKVHTVSRYMYYVFMYTVYKRKNVRIIMQSPFTWNVCVIAESTEEYLTCCGGHCYRGDERSFHGHTR